MLRALVVLLLLVNAALFAWTRSEPHGADREPQRLGRQVAPDSIQVLPDLPGASGAQGAASAPAAAASAASGAEVSSAAAASAVASAAEQAVAVASSANANASSTAVGAAASAVLASIKASAAAGFAHRTSEVDLDCSESGALDDAQMAALRLALTKAGVPAGALAERRQPQGGSWMVYIGRFTDSQSWQERADELKRLDIGFERVNSPSSLAPGLSLGQYPSPAEATKRLDDLGKHGVHTARVVVLTPPTFVRHLQVRATDPAWRHATGAQRFGTCPVETASKL